MEVVIQDSITKTIEDSAEVIIQEDSFNATTSIDNAGVAIEDSYEIKPYNPFYVTEYTVPESLLGPINADIETFRTDIQSLFVGQAGKLDTTVFSEKFDSFGKLKGTYLTTLTADYLQDAGLGALAYITDLGNYAIEVDGGATTVTVQDIHDQVAQLEENYASYTENILTVANDMYSAAGKVEVLNAVHNDFEVALVSNDGVFVGSTTPAHAFEDYPQGSPRSGYDPIDDPFYTDPLDRPSIGYKCTVPSGDVYKYFGGSFGVSNNGWVKVAFSADDIATTAELANVIADVSNLQAQVDGQIVSWFIDLGHTGTPLITEDPWLTWKTTDDANGNTNEQLAHTGDLLYNLNDGTSYRFVYNDSTQVFSWSVLAADNAVALALANAATAQATADGKMTIWYHSGTTNWSYPDAKLGDILYQYISATAQNVQYSALQDAPSLESHWSIVRDTEVTEWAAGASKLIKDPVSGGITGWEFADGSNLESTFRIRADLFEVVASTQTGNQQVPFSVNATTGDISFNGVVSFSSGQVNETMGWNTSVTKDNLITNARFDSTSTGWSYSAVDQNTEYPTLLQSKLYGEVWVLKQTDRDNDSVTEVVWVTEGERIYFGGWVNTYHAFGSVGIGAHFAIDGVAQPNWVTACTAPFGTGYPNWQFISGSLVVPTGYNSIIPWTQIDAIAGSTGWAYLTRIQVSRHPVAGVLETAAANALTSANGYTDGVATATLTSANSYTDSAANTALVDSRNNLAYQMGFTDYNHLVANAVTQGTTLIAGGYINTNLIQANAITANHIDVTNLFAQNITATGTITGVNLAGASIYTLNSYSLPCASIIPYYHQHSSDIVTSIYAFLGFIPPNGTGLATNRLKNSNSVLKFIGVGAYIETGVYAKRYERIGIIYSIPHSTSITINLKVSTTTLGTYTYTTPASPETFGQTWPSLAGINFYITWNSTSSDLEIYMDTVTKCDTLYSTLGATTLNSALYLEFVQSGSLSMTIDRCLFELINV